MKVYTELTKKEMKVILSMQPELFLQPQMGERFKVRPQATSKLAALQLITSTAAASCSQMLERESVHRLRGSMNDTADLSACR